MRQVFRGAVRFRLPFLTAPLWAAAVLGLLLLASSARAQFCGSSCIANSAAPQTAQFNVSSATIRGVLTVGGVSISSFTASTVTANVFVGSGTYLTGLNASQLTSGTVSSTTVTGPYYGITGLGTVSSGTWEATPLGTQWGGTGQNFVSVSTGSLIYFSSTGVMSTLLPPAIPQQLLMSNGYSAPFWTSSPTVSGVNLYNIPAARLTGDLPADVTVSSNSIPYVAGASVLGDISGNAQSINGTLLQSQIATGTWSTSYAASSITATGVPAGTYGSGTYAPQLAIQGDGRVYSATQLPITVGASSVTAGTFPTGLTLPLSDLANGTLPTSIPASSITVSGVTAGTYGGPYQIPSFTVGTDGRLTGASNNPVVSAITGTGKIPQDAVWISTYALTAGLLTETGGKVGISTAAPQAVLDVNGNAQFGTAGQVSTFTANGSLWLNGGSSLTLAGAQGWLTSASSVTAAAFFGDGSHLTGLNGDLSGGAAYNVPLWTNATTLGQSHLWDQSSPVATTTMTVQGNAFSVGAATFAVLGGDVGIGTSAPGSALDVLGVSQFGTSGSGFSSAGNLVMGEDSNITGTSSVTASGFFGNGAGLTDVTAAAIAASNVTAGTFGGGVLLPVGNLTGSPIATAVLPSTVAYTSASNTFTAAQTISNVNLSITGASGNIVGASSITASAFFGASTGLFGASQISGLGAQAQALNLNSNQIHNVTDPTSPQDAATKNYADASINGLQWKTSVRYATTGALPTNVYNNGSSGVGATLTGVSAGLLSVDGSNVSVGDRILVNNEATAANNGLYQVTQDASLLVYILTRTTDYDEPSQMGAGTAVFVDSGATNVDTGWVALSSVTTVGTSPVSFTQFTGLGNVVAGTGLEKSGNTISLVTPVSASNLVSTVAYTSVSNVFSAGAGNAFTYGVSAGSMSVTGSVTAASATWTGAGADITASTGKLGVRTANPAYAVHVSSGRLYLDGNDADPIQVGVNGSSLTLDSGGDLTVPSSMTAGAFFGYGGNLSGIPSNSQVLLLASSQTVSGAPTFTSNVTIGNGSGSGSLTVAAGSTMTIQGALNTSLSSCTADMSGLGTITQSGTEYAIAQTTITYDVQSSSINVCFFGSLTESGTNGEIAWGFLVDGNFVAPWTNAKGVMITPAGSGNTLLATSCGIVPVNAITYGLHRFAFVPYGGLGNTIGPNTTSVSNFCVQQRF